MRALSPRQEIMTMSLRFASISLALSAGLAFISGRAGAHVTLEHQQAQVPSYYKAVLRVPHGCKGSPTLKVRVRIPDGVVGVKPMPKAGWAMEVVKGPLAKPYTDHGREITEGVQEVVWTGKLLDEHYDEFVFRGQITERLKPGTMLYFPVVQECENGVHRWIEIPAEGKKPGDYQEPAPGVKLVPKS
jgi:uncharacterized protein YcnI